jgi:DNA-binding FrmR family transcriptional regulator
MLESTKEAALKRLRYVEGHLAGIRRMIQEEQYCVDILKQTYAVRRAIQKIESTILEGHLNTHVLEGIRNGRDREILSELMELYNLQEPAHPPASG